MGKDMEGQKQFFAMPGIDYEISRFKALLNISPSAHVLIRGPRGVGKSYFLQLFKELNPNTETVTLNCATIPADLASSELFGYKKGAFTGALQNTSGHIEEAHKKDAVLILEEFNSLSREDQAKLLVFMETSKFYPVGCREEKEKAVRIIATANHETQQENRMDVIDRFGIVVDVPALSSRREDIFYYIGKKYPDLVLDGNILLMLYSTFFPGNFREVDRFILEYQAGFSNKIYLDRFNDNFSKIIRVLNLYSREYYGLWNKECFGGLLPAGTGILGSIPPSLKIRLATSSEETAPDEIPQIVMLVGTKEIDVVDCRVVQTVFELFYGLVTGIENKSIFDQEPFSEFVFDSVKDYRQITDYEKWPEYQSFIHMHKPTRQVVNALFLAIEIICKTRHETASEPNIAAEQVAKFLLDGDDEYARFSEVVLAIKEIVGHGWKAKLARMLFVSEPSMNRWINEKNRWNVKQ